jgi:hypothetical protein
MLTFMHIFLMFLSIMLELVYVENTFVFLLPSKEWCHSTIKLSLLLTFHLDFACSKPDIHQKHLLTKLYEE